MGCKKAQYGHAVYIGTVPTCAIKGIYQNPDFKNEAKIRALDGLIDASLAEYMTKQQGSDNNTNAKA